MGENELERLTRVETELVNLKEIVLSMRDNHLKHLEMKVDILSDKINGRPSWITLMVVSGLAALVSLLIPIALNK